MSKNNKTAGDGTPSADEIIEALALEMGVESQKGEGEAVAAAPETPAEPAPEAPPAEEKKATKKSDDAIGGIFDIPSSSSSKPKGNKKKAAAPKGESAPAKSAGVDAIDTLFDVGGTKADVDLDDISGYGSMDEDKDLAKLERKVGGGSNRMLIGVVVVMGVAMIGMGIFAFGGMSLLDDIGAVAKGTYRDKKDAEKRRIEEEHRQKQLELMEKYGALNITGEPSHAVIFIQLEGEAAPTKRYAKTPKGLWRELNTPTIIQNLKIKKPINLRIEAPGYKPHIETLTQNMWQESAMAEFQYSMTRYLVPENEFVRGELEDRMLPLDEEMEINGLILVDSKPAGAKIKLNNRLVVDKDGNPVLTKADGPITLDHLMVDPEAKKKDPKPLKINTPPDNGYKIEMFFDTPETPRYVKVVQRNQWKCTVKEDKDLKKLKKEARPIEKCNYTFRVLGDFEAIKAEERRLKLVEEELQKQREALEQLQKETEEAAKKG